MHGDGLIWLGGKALSQFLEGKAGVGPEGGQQRLDFLGFLDGLQRGDDFIQTLSAGTASGEVPDRESHEYANRSLL